MPNRRFAIGRAVPAAVLVLAAACTDQPLAPVVEPEPAPAGLASLECTVQVRAGTMACAPLTATAPAGVHFDKIIGGQEVYVRLASSGASYDGGTQQFQMSVTVQNLLQQSMGTPDGVTTEGIRVFFNAGPTVTGGSGNVGIANEDGTDFFLSAAQPYFLYSQVLTPYEISSPKPWIFDVEPTVTSFSFVVYVAAALPDEGGAILDRVWDGSEGVEWETAGNWKDGLLPDSGSTVAIPADSLLGGGSMPMLAADAQVTNVRVGFGSSLDLNAYTLTTWGNVDATGAVQNGTVRLGGTGVLVGGTLPSVQVTGSARLQSAVVTSGAVSISDGALDLSGRTLSIQVP